jgi:cytochrome oxidase assembly protein ShyY1
MFRLSWWQWQRYLWKVELVNSYESLETTASREFTGPDYASLVDSPVKLRGKYDYSRQVIVTNKKHGEGSFSTMAGHHLLTPFLITDTNGEEKAVIVSRGFIPFEDRLPETWNKYSFEPAEELLNGVVKHSISPWLIGPKNPRTGEGREFVTRFFFEEIPKLAAQLPYPVIETVYIQRLGAPPVGEFPRQAVQIEVPPSTHYGYTLEWAALGTVTLIVGALLQLFPQYRGLFSQSGDECSAPTEQVLH